VKAFAEKVQFPSHALVVKKEKEDTDEIVSGITDWEKLNYLTIDMLQKTNRFTLKQICGLCIIRQG